MAILTAIRIQVLPTQRDNSTSTYKGVYLRWWYNGWHYWYFGGEHEVDMQSKAADLFTQQAYSVISRVESATKVTSKYTYRVAVEGVSEANIDGFLGLFMAEQVEQWYDDGDSGYNQNWYVVDVTRGSIVIKDAGEPAYAFDFEITRKEMPYTAAVYQKNQLLYIGRTLADLDDGEVIAITKQVNDIGELQDRQSDFTASFKVRKTRAMRELFQLAGEVGAVTNFPYENQLGRLYQDGIEIITAGRTVLNRVGDQYYEVSVYSGNLNFFKAIAGKKLADIDLSGFGFTWNSVNMANIATGNNVFTFALCEPTDDGGMMPDRGFNIWGGYIWPMVSVGFLLYMTIEASGYQMDEAFDDWWEKNATLVDGLYIPLSSLTVNAALVNQYKYSSHWSGTRRYQVSSFLLGWPDGWGNAVLTLGTETFRLGLYIAPFTATYSVRVVFAGGTILSSPPNSMLLWVNEGDSNVPMTLVSTFISTWTFEGEVQLNAGDWLQILVDFDFDVYYWTWQITDIKDAALGFGSVIDNPAQYLPDMEQTDLVKMFCNLLGLVPEVNPWTRTISFWNYSDLYRNKPQARDWSAYLSEHDDEGEFKFGEYAQQNYFRYKASNDVQSDNGVGILQLVDETLPPKKDVVTLPLATADEVNYDGYIFSRLPFNKWDAQSARYKENKSIEGRLVYVTRPDIGITWNIYDDWDNSGTYTACADPNVCRQQPISFSTLLAPYYGALGNMLVRTHLRRVKLNLPAYEVAGFKHNVPIYLQQYKAYFYVNKISNFVVGKLCTVELISLSQAVSPPDYNPIT
jgi:hypothetical protein